MGRKCYMGGLHPKRRRLMWQAAFTTGNHFFTDHTVRAVTRRRCAAKALDELRRLGYQSARLTVHGALPFVVEYGPDWTAG